MFNNSLLTSNSDEWYTPTEIIDFIKYYFNTTITTDPCCSIYSKHGLKYNYNINDNGLTKKWMGTTFVNPPYSNIKEWVLKSYQESLFSYNAKVIMLIPARTDTKYWHDIIFKSASHIYFIKGRIRFNKILNEKIVKGESAPFPCAIVVFSKEQARIIDAIDLKKQLSLF